MFSILLIHVRATPRVGGSGFCNPFVGFTVDRQHFWQGGKTGLFHCGKFYPALWHWKTWNSWISAWSDQNFALKGLVFEFSSSQFAGKADFTREKKKGIIIIIKKSRLSPFFPFTKVSLTCTVKSASQLPSCANPFPSEELRKELFKEKLMSNFLVQLPTIICATQQLLLNPQYFVPEATKFCFAAILQDTPRSWAQHWVDFSSPCTQSPPGVSLIKTGHPWSKEESPALAELPSCSGKMENLPDSSLLWLQGKQHQPWLRAAFWSFPPFRFPVPKTIFPGLLKWLDKDQLLLHHQHSKEETQSHWWSFWSALISQL